MDLFRLPIARPAPARTVALTLGAESQTPRRTVPRRACFDAARLVAYPGGGTGPVMPGPFFAPIGETPAALLVLLLSVAICTAVATGLNLGAGVWQQGVRESSG